MDIDPDNVVVELCTKGMEAEAAGPPGRARELFEQAWDASTDDYERCIAAHYLARQQGDATSRLEWNTRCLELADLVSARGQGELVAGFYPSLHVNLGRDHAELGDRDAAVRHYRAAEARVAVLGDDGYGEMLRRGIDAGLVGLGETPAPAPSARISG